MNVSGNISVQLDSGEVRTAAHNGGHKVVADILDAAGLPLNTRCGKRGLCRGCEVELENGSVELDGKTIAAPATIRACRAFALGDVSIHLPARSRLEHRPQVGETFEIGVPYAHQPLFAPTSARDTAFAVDIGTTTVVVLLVDLFTGEVLSRAGGFNQQIRFGDNVVTRIEAAHTAENRAAMQRAIVTETIQPLLLRACERAGRVPNRIIGGAIAGNTTMLHLLAGKDPTPLGVAPFTAQFLAGRGLVASEIGLAIDGIVDDLPIQLLPGISAYIGADIAAGIFATGMVFDSEPSLLVDIGTNGEVVLQHGGKLFGCATAAGPAFEGCGLGCGMRATAGAISTLNLKRDPFQFETETIGEIPVTKAKGICGSAYIDFLATGRSSGLLNSNGRFDKAVWNELPVQNRSVIENQFAVQISGSNSSGVSVSEVDVALLLQAKAAIGAGIETLLMAAGVQARDLNRVYLAGGFGMHLDVEHAIAIGLLPGVRFEQVRVVGNTALAGALLALVDRTALDEMENMRSQVEVVDLNLSEGFEDRYTEHLMLP